MYYAVRVAISRKIIQYYNGQTYYELVLRSNDLPTRPFTTPVQQKRLHQIVLYAIVAALV